MKVVLFPKYSHSESVVDDKNLLGFVLCLFLGTCMVANLVCKGYKYDYKLKTYHMTASSNLIYFIAYHAANMQ